MKTCNRCGSKMVQEHYADPQSRGQRWTCLLCGESLEQADPNESRMTLDQLEDLARPSRRGRPRKVR